MYNSSTSYFNEEIYKTEEYFITDLERLEIKNKIQNLITEKKRIYNSGKPLKDKINATIKNNRSTMIRTKNYMHLGGNGNKLLSIICKDYYDNIEKPIVRINEYIKSLKLAYKGLEPYFSCKDNLQKEFFSFNIGNKFDFK